jgi:hypothetical protein
MKLKFLSLVSAALLALATTSFAGDVYMIGQPNSLITANHSDLQTFMGLNARGVKPAVRTLYRKLSSKGLLFNLQPGAQVNVVEYYPDGIAKITWANGAYRGFISKNDLTAYLGSSVENDNNDNRSAWANNDDYGRKTDEEMEATHSGY